MEPKVVRADDSHRISLYDIVFRYGVAADETDGALSMLEVTIPPDLALGPHAIDGDAAAFVVRPVVPAGAGKFFVERVLRDARASDFYNWSRLLVLRAHAVLLKHG